jgi:large subunit ribosomal protein L24
MTTKDPTKQRRQRKDAPIHRRQKLVTAPLEKGLRDELGRRNLPLRSGDEVEVVRGDFKGKTSDVRDVDLDDLKVTLEDVKREKVDGTEVRPKIDPSNLMIVEPDLSDPEREAIVERAGGKVKEEFKKKAEEEGEEIEEEEKEEGFKCEICGNVYDSKRGLSIHKGKSHPEYMK